MLSFHASVRVCPVQDSILPAGSGDAGAPLVLHPAAVTHFFVETRNYKKFSLRMTGLRSTKVIDSGLKRRFELDVEHLLLSASGRLLGASERALVGYGDGDRR